MTWIRRIYLDFKIFVLRNKKNPCISEIENITGSGSFYLQNIRVICVLKDIP